MLIYLTVEVERMEGKFVSRADLEDALVDVVASYGTLDVEDSSYEITNVEADAPAKPTKKKKGA